MNWANLFQASYENVASSEEQFPIRLVRDEELCLIARFRTHHPLKHIMKVIKAWLTYPVVMIRSGITNI